jgi:hypothetical protein
MKAIINGKRYDEDTADKVASANSGVGPGDFRHYRECLYITPKGNWFLAGEGGPRTKYSHQAGNAISGGAKIIVLTPDEAREWLEAEGEHEALEKYFSDKLEDA